MSRTSNESSPPHSNDWVRIAVAPCFFHADSERPIFKGKTLLYFEQSLASEFAREGVLLQMLPLVDDPQRLEPWISRSDGLLLQGGTDVSPGVYGEQPIRPEWRGDPIRDRNEIRLIELFLKQRKPILGICRGAQILNVALGGTLYQDIELQVPLARTHRDWKIYDANHHFIRLERGSLLSRLHPDRPRAIVNSIHHQGIRQLGHGLRVEAVCEDDSVIEAIRLDSEIFVYGVQWHPEFHRRSEYLPTQPLFQEFIRAAQISRQTHWRTSC